MTESAPLVETSNASQGQVIDNQKLTDLPNLGRNPFMMSKLAQNVVPVGNPAYNRMEDQSGSSQISIAGGPVRGNNYLIDGVPITDATNRAIIIPSLEAVQEVKIQANTYDAEMARTGGGMFNTLMKSGTNNYHGSLYGHLRRTAWDANSFFNNAAGRSHYRSAQRYLGRQLRRRGLDSRSSTTARTRRSSTWARSTTTTLSRFVAFRHPHGAREDGRLSLKSNVYHLRSAERSSTACATPFAGNIIPPSCINPVGLAIASYYATRNRARQLRRQRFQRSGQPALPRRADTPANSTRISSTGGAPA